MAHKLSSVEIIREQETAVLLPQGLNRFITIVGSMPDVPVGGGKRHAETYSCLVGPVLKDREFLGASCLPSIAYLDVTGSQVAQCSIESSETRWDEDSGRVELLIQVLATGGPTKAVIVFAATILVAD